MVVRLLAFEIYFFCTMKKQIVSLLKKYGYKVGYSCFHNPQELKRFSKKSEPNMDRDGVFTVFSKDSLVIRRIPNLYKDQEMTEDHVDMLCETFSIYELPNKDKLLKYFHQLLSKKHL